MVLLKVLKGVLNAGNISLTFTDNDIIDESKITIYTDDPANVYAKNSVVSGHSLTITFDKQTKNHQVRVLINNLENTFEPVEFDPSDIYREIGQLSELYTENKDNLVDALNEVFQNVSNGKMLIADAITDKGVETSAEDTFQTMADNIMQIVSGTVFGDLSRLELLNTKISSVGNGTVTYTFPHSLFAEQNMLIFVSRIYSINTGGMGGSQNRFNSVTGATAKIFHTCNTSGSGITCYGVLYNLTGGDISISITHNMSGTHHSNAVSIYGLVDREVS